MITDELVREYVTTENEVEAREILILLVFYFMSVYDEERETFANDNDVPAEWINDENIRDEYEMYVFDLLVSMRERVKEEKEKLRDLEQTAFLIAIYHFIDVQFTRIHETEISNAKQIAQLQVATAVQDNNSAAKIYKRWVARTDSCEMCKALDGVIKPIDEPFLINGQVVELSSGKEIIYGYIDRGVAIAHPNDRCSIEFIIEY